LKYKEPPCDDVYIYTQSCRACCLLRILFFFSVTY
jgi:hypothetical protein